jgi:hypothetical protein
LGLDQDIALGRNQLERVFQFFLRAGNGS